MNVCLIGNSLTSLTLAKSLINKKIKVFLYYEKAKKIINQSRTIGITSDNLDFIQKEIIKLNVRHIWGINQIEIFNSDEEKILNFKKSRKNLFFIIKNEYFSKLLLNSLNKNNNFKKIFIKSKNFYSKIIDNKDFDLIINCDKNNIIQKKYFNKKVYKNYYSNAYVSIVEHSKKKNKKALQIFTKLGPLAYLPMSPTKTSIVFSVKDKKLNDSEFKKLIIKNNKKLTIKSIMPPKLFKLTFNTLNKYYSNNILGFGDCLHQIHPFAGQGFNMTVRDIKSLLNLINSKKELGLEINKNIYQEFEKKNKHLNFLFASGIDFIYNFFYFDNYYLNLNSKKLFKYINNNKLFNNLFIKYANRGLNP